MLPTSKLTRIAFGLAAVGAASFAVAFSGAFFASEDTSEASSVGTAEVALHVLNSERHVFSATTLIAAADGLRPGAQAPEKVVELSDAGDLPVKLHLTSAALPTGQGLQLLQALHLDVDDCGISSACASPASAYSGTLSGLSDVAFDGTLAPGDHRFVRLRLGWPAANDDPSLYGVDTSFSFHWTATTAGA